MILDVPLEIDPAKVGVVFRPIPDDAVQMVEAVVFGRAQFPAQGRLIQPAPQRPDREDKRESSPLLPGRTQVPDLVLVRGADKFKSSEWADL